MDILLPTVELMDKYHAMYKFNSLIFFNFVYIPIWPKIKNKMKKKKTFVLSTQKLNSKCWKHDE